MAQAARQLVDAADGFAPGKTHLIIDRDTKYCEGFRQILQTDGVKIVLCPARIPQCNAFAERWILSVRIGILSQLILLAERSLAYHASCPTRLQGFKRPASFARLC